MAGSPSSFQVSALLFVFDGDEASRAVNAKYRSAGEKFDSYVRQAIQLHRSLKRFHDRDLIVVTNARERVVEAMASLAPATPPIVREGDFERRVEAGATFAEAHHKVDLLRHLAGEAESSYQVLMDLDVCCRRAPSAALRRLVDDGVPCLYDVTDEEMPSRGVDRMAGDLESVIGAGRRLPTGRVRWFGGEFIGGRPSFFRELADGVEALWPAYVARRERLSHQGAEVALSAAMCELAPAELADAGRLGIISRHWTVRTRVPTAPLWRALRSDFLHLPSAKGLLAANATRADPIVRPRQLLAREALLQGRSLVCAALSGRP